MKTNHMRSMTQILMNYCITYMPNWQMERTLQTPTDVHCMTNVSPGMRMAGAVNLQQHQMKPW